MESLHKPTVEDISRLRDLATKLRYQHHVTPSSEARIIVPNFIIFVSYLFLFFSLSFY